jgi:hypothetical protein
MFPTNLLSLRVRPRTGSIMAHECMHAYLRLSGFQTNASADKSDFELPPQVEEGLCQLIALLWLEQAGAAMVHADKKQARETAAFEERLSAFFGHAIRTDASVVYGDGFRTALARFQRTGGRMEALLDHLRRKGSL